VIKILCTGKGNTSYAYSAYRGRVFENNSFNEGFEVLTAVVMKSSLF
jgi:hypothetical protein